MLEDIINTHFPSLLKKRGFKLVAEQHSESFGDALTDLESPEFRLRFVSDRLQIIVDIGSNTPNNKWFWLGFVRSSVLDGELLPLEEYAEQALFLEQHYSTLATMFNSQNISEITLRLEKFIDEWQRRERPSWFKS
jgi:hypothetical protein